MAVPSNDRLKQVCDYAYKYGDAQASEKFDLTLDSLFRYKRWYNKKPSAKILVFDIENAPVQAYVWNMKVWKAFVGADMIEHDWFMLTWSAKWLNDSEIIHDKLTPKEAKKRDDTRLVKNLWELFNEADIVIAHNANKFDVPMANTRFILNGLPPVTPYQIIDTLVIARQNFRFTHNKLDYLGSLFGLGNKIQTQFQLWVDCMKGKKKALQEMLYYNDQDVLLLEEVYYKLRGWMKSHPNMNLYSDDEKVCSHCGSRNIKAKGKYRTSVNEYQTYQCQEKKCGGFSRVNKKSMQAVAR